MKDTIMTKAFLTSIILIALFAIGCGGVAGESPMDCGYRFAASDGEHKYPNVRDCHTGEGCVRVYSPTYEAEIECADAKLEDEFVRPPIEETPVEEDKPLEETPVEETPIEEEGFQGYCREGETQEETDMPGRECIEVHVSCSREDATRGDGVCTTFLEYWCCAL